MTPYYTAGLETRILATNPAALQFANLEAATSWITVDKPSAQRSQYVANDPAVTPPYSLTAPVSPPARLLPNPP